MVNKVLMIAIPAKLSASQINRGEVSIFIPRGKIAYWPYSGTPDYYIAEQSNYQGSAHALASQSWSVLVLF